MQDDDTDYTAEKYLTDQPVGNGKAPWCRFDEPPLHWCRSTITFTLNGRWTPRVPVTQFNALWPSSEIIQVEWRPRRSYRVFSPTFPFWTFGICGTNTRLDERRVSTRVFSIKVCVHKSSFNAQQGCLQDIQGIIILFLSQGNVYDFELRYE